MFAENSDEKCTELFIKVGRIQFLVLALIMSGFVFFGREFIVYIWGGKEYVDSYYMALLLMIPVTVPLIQNVGIEIQRAKNKHQFRSIIYMGIALVNICLSLPLCQYYGGIGCAIGTAVSLFIGNILIMNIYYHRRLGINIIKFWREICRIMRGLILPIIVGVLIKNILRVDEAGLLLIEMLVYVIVYLISMYAFGMNEYEKNMINKVIKR